jgi:hypothetical protein
MLAFVVLNDKLPPERQDADNRSIALLELKKMLGDLEVADSERERLRTLIDGLKGDVP